MTAEEFEKWYAANSGMSVEKLREIGLTPRECDCGRRSCTGWRMIRSSMTNQDDEIEQTTRAFHDTMKANASLFGWQKLFTEYDPNSPDSDFMRLTIAYTVRNRIIFLPSQIEEVARLLREVLEEVCKRDGISLDSKVDPGKPARNYELMTRLGIDYLIGLQPEPEDFTDLPGAPSEGEI